MCLLLGSFEGSVELVRAGPWSPWDGRIVSGFVLGPLRWELVRGKLGFACVILDGGGLGF